MGPCRIAIASCLLVGSVSTARAQQHEDDEATINPLAARNLVRVQPSYEHIDAGGDQTSVLLRTTVVMGTPEVYGLARVDVPLESLHSSSANAAGLEDVQLLVLLDRQWPSVTIGGGLGVVIPTATSDALGDGKLQLAPAFAAMVTGVPKARLGALARNFFSVAGDANRADLDYLSFQPLLTLHVSPQLFLVSDATMQFNWKKGGDATIPVDLEAGHAFSSRLTMVLGPQWVITGSGQNNVSVILKIDYENW